MLNGKIHVHFMGICGSGCASIAILAHSMGYAVSGCDQSTDSYYGEELKKQGIRLYTGHDAGHLTEDVDIVAVSPALFDINPDNPELLAAQRKGILMTWQAFMGACLQKEKRVIAISGTHGKTTTTFLTAELLIDGGKDPSVVGGSVYKKWGSGGRFGASNLFLCEADEFNRNFHHYKPELAVMTNVEMDHPECYNNYEEVLASFETFLLGSEGLKTILLNGNDPGALEVLKRTAAKRSMENIRVIAFVKDQTADFSGLSVPVSQAVYRILDRELGKTTFSVDFEGRESVYSIAVPGDYNVANGVCALLIARCMDVSEEAIEKALMAFEGAGRRFDKVGLFQNVPVYDDYAHHPTEIRSVLTMCRDYYKDRKVVAVFEPHQVSRLRLMFRDYVDALCIADHVVIQKTHLGREIHRAVVPITKEEWCNASDKMMYEEDPEKIRDILKDLRQRGECDMVLVIGAANSYKLSRFLCQN